MKLLRVVAVLLLCSHGIHSRAEERPQLWLYYSTNLLVDKNVEQLSDVWRRAAAAGYDHVLLADSKFAKLGDMDKRYFANIDRVKKLAAELKIEVVPAMFDIGYSNNLLWHDPNLAEGLPVKDQPFVVQQDGQARPATEVRLPPKVGYADPSVKLDAGTATVTDNAENARFNYALKLPRYRCYHVSVKIRTDGYTGTPELKALGAGAGSRSLQWQNLGVKHTQDWTEHHVVFNTLDNDAVTLYFGVWGSAKGSLQWKDWRIEESGLVNVLRRPGAPCTVKAETGRTLTEGKDYEPIVDPNLGNHPWSGEYDAWHAPVSIRTKLPAGTRLLVSWYHPAIIYDGQVSACISEPKLNELLAGEAKRMTAAWGAGGYMMSYDEFRTLGWDEACEKTHRTPGEMLADNTRYCTGLLGNARAYTWNDMFDPFHNAVKGPYYLVNGPWTGSWEGLDKRVIIFNWNHGKRDQSLKFFADRGHRQIIAGYYDGPPENDRQWVESSRKVGGVIGFMYTTWRGDFSKIEQYAKIVGR
jgi:hypothetical protein